MAAKPFKETGLGKFLASKGFTSVLAAVGAELPGAKLLSTVVSLVTGSPEYKQLSPEDQQQFMELHRIELEELDQLVIANLNDEKELTERAKNDMLSDSWLSKNIRPCILIFLSLVITALCSIDSAKIGFEVDAAWIELFKMAWLGALSYYFIGRSIEKAISWKEKSK